MGQMRVNWQGMAVVVALVGARPLVAQSADSLPPPPSRITNAGVIRATAINDSVFISRTRLVDTVDIGDFTALMLARIGAPRFDESLAFTVTADSSRIRITGRLSDFPPEYRSELGPIFAFLDPSSPVMAEVSMPRADSGLIAFRLDRLSVRGIAIPDMLLGLAMNQMQAQYPRTLSPDGRQFHVAIPREARAHLIQNAIVLEMRRAP